MSEQTIHTDITVTDIQLVLNIIDVCAKRGAFAPSEFVTVGSLVSKLSAAISPLPEPKPLTDAEHLRAVGKEKQALLVEACDAIYDETKAMKEAALAEKQTALDEKQTTTP
jgi:hypothetical protein